MNKSIIDKEIEKSSKPNQKGTKMKNKITPKKIIIVATIAISLSSSFALLKLQSKIDDRKIDAVYTQVLNQKDNQNQLAAEELFDKKEQEQADSELEDLQKLEQKMAVK